MRGRIKSELSYEMCEYIGKPAITEENARSFGNMSELNYAHVLMLMDQKIIDKVDGIKILKALHEIYNAGASAIEIHPEYEDYYFNIEKIVIAKAGMEVGGKMHTARSRNDLGTTLLRMNARDAVMRVIPRLVKLEKVILKMAAENQNTIMTGYTHMQPAQPISLGYYLCAVAQTLERDIQRLEAALERMNYCTLGSCAFAGTSFPVDRQKVASDLGFYGPVYNSMDAIAARDYIQELTAAYTILSTNLSRLCADFYYWSTDEFGYFELDDSFAVCSSIMPQKKNPVPFEYVRAKSGHMLAAFTSVTMALKGIAFGHNRDGGGEAPHMFWDATDQMVASLELLSGTLSTINVRKERMLYRVNANFCTVTELADRLVKEEGMPFRVAHEIVAEVVCNCVENGKTCLDIDSALLDRYAEQHAGRKLGWDDAKIRYTLDAESSVLGKHSYGACAPEECSAMIETVSKNVQDGETRFNAFESLVTDSLDALRRKVADVIGE